VHVTRPVRAESTTDSAGDARAPAPGSLLACGIVSPLSEYARRKESSERLCRRLRAFGELRSIPRPHLPAGRQAAWASRACRPYAAGARSWPLRAGCVRSCAALRAFLVSGRKCWRPEGLRYINQKHFARLRGFVCILGARENARGLRYGNRVKIPTLCPPRRTKMGHPKRSTGGSGRRTSSVTGIGWCAGASRSPWRPRW